MQWWFEREAPMGGASSGCAPQKVDPALIARFRPVMDRWLLRAGRPDDATDGCFGSQMLAAAA